MKFRVSFFHDNYSFNSIPLSATILASFLAPFGSLLGTLSGVISGALPGTFLCRNSRKTKRFGLPGAPKRARFGRSFGPRFGVPFGLHFRGSFGVACDDGDIVFSHFILSR